jgi:hypothetical protein
MRISGKIDNLVKYTESVNRGTYNFGDPDKNQIREHLKTSVFRCSLTPWRKLHVCNLFHCKELAIFSVASLKTRPGFLEMPILPFFNGVLPYWKWGNSPDDPAIGNERKNHSYTGPIPGVEDHNKDIL